MDWNYDYGVDLTDVFKNKQFCSLQTLI